MSGDHTSRKAKAIAKAKVKDVAHEYYTQHIYSELGLADGDRPGWRAYWHRPEIQELWRRRVEEEGWHD